MYSTRVTFPVYTKIAGDKDRLRKAFVKDDISYSRSLSANGININFFPNTNCEYYFG